MNNSELNTNGTDYVSDAEFDALISELQSITEEARATDYHDTLRKAALFLNLLKSKVHEYAKDIVRLDAACTEQHAAYVSACKRVDEINDLDYAKAQVRSANYSLVSAEFISNFAEFIQDWRKGDFDLPRLAALDVEACFDAWQKEINQKEVKPVLQAMEPSESDKTADNDKVICPECCSQFTAIPVNVQARLQALERVPMTEQQAAFLYGKACEAWVLAGNDNPFLSYCRAIEAHHGITPPESKG